MGKKDRRIASLKKETIRKLDARAISSDDLAKVHGGRKPPYTCNCPTSP